eukprot:scaffold69464_cov45-Phaeocystis_antarctica.AAC.2
MHPPVAVVLKLSLQSNQITLRYTCSVTCEGGGEGGGCDGGEKGGGGDCGGNGEGGGGGGEEGGGEGGDEGSGGEAHLLCLGVDVVNGEDPQLRPRLVSLRWPEAGTSAALCALQRNLRARLLIVARARAEQRSPQLACIART